MTTAFYHRTRRDVAEDIIAHGFRDGTGTYMTGDEHSGVWLSDRPLDGNDMGLHDMSARVDYVILHVTLPYSLDFLARYEWVEDMEDEETGETLTRNYREWLIPAGRINGVATIAVLEEDP